MARQGRQAGIINPTLVTGRSEFQGGPGNFDSEQWGAAYWCVGTVIYGASGGRICQDARTELGGTNPENRWSDEMLNVLIARVRAMGNAGAIGSQNTPTRDATYVTRELLRWAIWFTYHRVATAHIDAVRLPAEVILPRLGHVMAPGANAAMARDFNVTSDANSRYFESTAWDPYTQAYQEGDLDVRARDIRGDAPSPAPPPPPPPPPGPGVPRGDVETGGSDDAMGAVLAVGLGLLAMGSD